MFVTIGGSWINTDQIVRATPIDRGNDSGLILNMNDGTQLSFMGEEAKRLIDFLKKNMTIVEA